MIGCVSYRFDAISMLALTKKMIELRNHLVTLFFLLFEQEYNTRDLDKYPHLEHKGLPLIKRTRSIFTRLRIAYKLLTIKKTPNFFCRLDSAFYCRMAGLMLFMALGEEPQKEYIVKADEYMSKVYFRRRSKLDDDRTWRAVRDELKEFHKLGIV